MTLRLLSLYSFEQVEMFNLGVLYNTSLHVQRIVSYFVARSFYS